MNGTGCKNCPVKPCHTLYYRGSYCSEQRAKHGLGDPLTNGERIRAWNDHELAETIANLVSEIDNGDVRYSDDPNDWYEWLKQPAED